MWPCTSPRPEKVQDVVELAGAMGDQTLVWRGGRWGCPAEPPGGQLGAIKKDLFLIYPSGSAQEPFIKGPLMWLEKGAEAETFLKLCLVPLVR